jgi:glycosyltransferase involved in cell wall biosynthesis
MDRSNRLRARAALAATAQPYFSVITATFNAGALLSRTAASLAAQTSRDFEWLVIDGGSSDDTVERVRDAGSTVSHWISEPDSGIADAWNKGLRQVRGEYVLLLNAGDTYDATFLRNVADVADGRRIVCSHVRLWAESGRLLGTFRARPERLRYAMHVPHNWCAVPARHYVELGPYSTLPLAMDFEWFHRYFLRYGAAGFVVVDQTLGDYHLGGISDRNYVAGFRANEQIVVSHGANPLLARIARWAYTLNHSMRRRRR